MDAFDAEAELLRLLRERGVETTEVYYAHVGRGDDARAAWDAFKTLAATPVDETTADADGDVWRVDPDEGDMLMFEAGAGERRPPRGWRSEGEPAQPEAFMLTFTRQFSFLDADGEYLAMNGLVLEFEFEPRAGHPHIRDNIVGTDAPAWIAEVEGSKAFAAAFEHLPFSFNLLQTDY